MGTLCSVVTDNDGAIHTIFVTGAQDEMIAAAAVSFTASAGTLDDANVPTAWTGVSAGDILILISCTPAAAAPSTRKSAARTRSLSAAAAS